MDELKINPLAVETESAAIIIGLSAQTLEKTRREDKQRKERGLPPEGPKWVKVGKRVIYRLEDLKEWLEQKQVEQWSES